MLPTSSIGRNRWNTKTILLSFLAFCSLSYNIVLYYHMILNICRICRHLRPPSLLCCCVPSMIISRICHLAIAQPAIFEFVLVQFHVQLWQSCTTLRASVESSEEIDQRDQERESVVWEESKIIIRRDRTGRRNVKLYVKNTSSSSSSSSAQSSMLLRSSLF